MFNCFQPNREDECSRIEALGGKVINWDGHRVSGVLAVSRSIGMYIVLSARKCDCDCTVIFSLLVGEG